MCQGGGGEDGKGEMGSGTQGMQGGPWRGGLGRGCMGGVTAVLSYFSQSSPLTDLVYEVGYQVEVCLQNQSHG